MINAVGGGDSVIELTGFTGKEKNGERVRDNVANIGFAFYVTNTGQFNFNLPKQRFQTSYRKNDARYGSYENLNSSLGGLNGGTLGNADFYTWEKSYPYQMPEGCLVNLKVILIFVPIGVLLGNFIFKFTSELNFRLLISVLGALTCVALLINF